MHLGTCNKQQLAAVAVVEGGACVAAVATFAHIAVVRRTRDRGWQLFAFVVAISDSQGQAVSGARHP